MSREWVDRLKRVFEELGLSYEIEEAVRVHIDDLIIQLSEAEDGQGISVSISVALPSEDMTLEDAEKCAKSIEKALRIAAMLNRGELSYELDTSLPSYPTLYIARKYSDREAIVEDFVKALRSLSS